MRPRWPTRLTLVKVACKNVVLHSAVPPNSADEEARGQSARLACTRRRTNFCGVLLLAICSVFVGERVLAAEPRNKSSVKDPAKDQITLKKEDIRLMEEEILRLTNQHRARKGLTTLESSPPLRLLAQHQSRNMCNAGLLAHESKTFPEGWQRFSERLNAVGVRSGAENVAFGTILKEPEQWSRMIVKGWMKSLEHRKSMLNPKFEYLGIAVVQCKGNIAYATQVFSAEPGRIRRGQLTR
jgi:uncharacterized protein YkwD